MPMPEAAAKQAETHAAPAAAIFADTRNVFASHGEGVALKVSPNHPFRLRFRPDLWEVVRVEAQAVLVPQLSLMVLAPGINGVLPANKNRTAADAVRAAAKRSDDQGYKILDPDVPLPASCLPAGVKPGGYLRATPCRSRTGVVGQRWHEAFVTFDAAFGQVQEVWHMEQRNRWLLELVKAGAFGRPSAEVLRRLGVQAQAAYERALAAAWPVEIRKDRVARAKAPLDALTAAEKALEAASA